MSGGEEMKDLVGPCSSSFLPHCGLEGSQSPFYLLSFRKGFFCQSSCTAAQELFEAKINLYFMWLLLFLSWPFVSFHLLLEAEAYLKQTGLLLALQTELSSELTDYFYSSGRLHWQKETKGSNFSCFLHISKKAIKINGDDTLQNSLPMYTSTDPRSTEHLLLPRKYLWQTFSGIISFP